MAHLTIPAGEPFVSYTPGGSSTGPFNVTFPIFSTDDLNVMVNGVLLSSSDWTFTPTDTRTGGYQAGYITLDSATTYEVVIYRDTTRSRTSDYASGPLDINTLNTDVDRTVARDQDLKMLIDRSIRQPLNDAAAIGRLPAKADRASKYLAFDANGDPTAIAYAISTTGVSGFMATLLDDTTATLARSTLSAIGKVVTQVFTGSGTYTPTSGMLYAIIECVGGGGGGGGMGNASAGAQGCSGSGGGGGYSRKVATAADIGASKTVTIGAGGAAGSAGGGNGGNAGDTSVGSLCIAKGGSAGSGGANGVFGAGGIAGTGDVTIPGASGETGLASSIVTVNLRRSAGGASALGFGAGGPGGPGQANGNAGAVYGGGGGGAQSSNAGGTASGGAGAPGIVIITEFCV